MTSGFSRFVDIAAEFRRDTDKGICLFDGDQEVWLPKSQVEDNGDGTYSMPEWLAMEKGLI